MQASSERGARAYGVQCEGRGQVLRSIYSLVRYCRSLRAELLDCGRLSRQLGSHIRACERRPGFLHLAARMVHVSNRDLFLDVEHVREQIVVLVIASALNSAYFVVLGFIAWWIREVVRMFRALLVHNRPQL